MTQLWVINSKLSSEDSSIAMIEVFRKFGLNWAAQPTVPFSRTVIDFDWENGPVFYYGSINTIKNVLRQKPRNARLFYKPEKFTTTVYSEVLGDEWLNRGAISTTIEEFLKSTAPNKSRFFRPDTGDKSFAGCVNLVEDQKKFLEINIANNNCALSDKIWISAPKNIQTEYRTWIIDRQCVAGTCYKEKGLVKPRALNEHEEIVVKNYANYIAQNYIDPPEVYTLDIALDEYDRHTVIEINDVHASGWYTTHQIHDVIYELSNYIAKYPENK